jgi:hypothetical protein
MPKSFAAYLPKAKEIIAMPISRILYYRSNV